MKAKNKLNNLTQNDPQPLISCLMVTFPVHARWRFFQESVLCFSKQTWKNRELIILCDRRATSRDFKRVRHWIETLKDDKIRVVRAPRKLLLGELRNASMTYARGKIACLWDDDDLSHPSRLEKQAKALLKQGRGAVYLRDVLHFQISSKDMYLARWGRTHLL